MRSEREKGGNPALRESRTVGSGTPLVTFVVKRKSPGCRAERLHQEAQELPAPQKSPGAGQSACISGDAGTLVPAKASGAEAPKRNGVHKFHVVPPPARSAIIERTERKREFGGNERCLLSNSMTLKKSIGWAKSKSTPCAMSTSGWKKGSSASLSARPARAKPPSSTSWAGWIRSARARSGWTARKFPPTTSASSPSTAGTTSALSFSFIIWCRI